MKKSLALLFTLLCLGHVLLLPPLSAAQPEAGQTVLVTGANRGLGLEFARQYLARGYQVIGTARNPAEAAELRELGAQVEQLDVADSASARALAARLKGQSIDILINNAGISGYGARTFRDLEIDKLVQSFEVNSLGALRVTQALLDNLQQGKTKKIVQISTIMASVELNEGGAYGYRASKSALNMFNKSLAAELGRDGYICVALHPGWVRTDMGGESAPLSPEQSISGMIALIDGLKPDQNGQFLDYQGEKLPW